MERERHRLARLGARVRRLWLPRVIAETSSHGPADVLLWVSSGEVLFCKFSIQSSHSLTNIYAVEKMPEGRLEQGSQEPMPSFRGEQKVVQCLR